MRINEGGDSVSRAASRGKVSKSAASSSVQPEFQLPPDATYDQLDFVTDKHASVELPGTCRWPDAAFPLKLWLVENPEIPEFEADTFAMLAQWEFASDHQIRFIKAESLDAADIIVDWMDEATTGRKYEMGHAKREVTPLPKADGSLRGEITFVKVNLHKKPLINAYLSTKNALKCTFFATILHEFGHVLGLEHSQNPSDVMYYRGFLNAKLSPNDVNRLKLLYPPQAQ